MVVFGKLAAAPAVEDDVQRRLVTFNERRLRPAVPADDWRTALREEQADHAVEMEFIERERKAVAGLVAGVPHDAVEFVRWFESLERTGPGQHDPLFEYLAEQASREEMVWFLTQEVSGEAGFDDLVALTQVKMPVTAKLELARNYWDEMGRGHERGMHGPMLAKLAKAVGVDARAEDTVWESLALANLMAGLAANRCYAFQSVGALGVIELTAPGRATLVNRGLKRLGVSAGARQYYALHATLDVQHSVAWNREVLATLVADRPELARPIAEGALMRLCAGERCFARYKLELGLDALSATR